MAGPISIPEPIVTARPYDPIYVSGDKDVIPDEIYEHLNPSADVDLLPDELLSYTKITFLCWYKYRNRFSNCWKIQAICINENAGRPGLNTTTVLYPWGLDSYNFRPRDIRHYTFSRKY